MRKFTWAVNYMATGTMLLAATPLPAAEPAPKVPRFSLDYMDRSVDPGAEFYRYADGNWIKHNPVPADKSRWGAFMELTGAELAFDSRHTRIDHRWRSPEQFAGAKGR